MKKNIFFKFVVLFVISIFFNDIFAADFLYKIDEENAVKKTDSSSISTNSDSPVFNLQSTSQILVEPKTGTILYANNENEKLYPASVTKVMTLLLLMEKIDSGVLSYTDIVTCSANASKMGGSQIWFKEGETLTIDEALKAICISSANDVTAKF